MYLIYFKVFDEIESTDKSGTFFYKRPFPLMRAQRVPELPSNISTMIHTVGIRNSTFEKLAVADMLHEVRA